MTRSLCSPMTSTAMGGMSFLHGGHSSAEGAIGFSGFPPVASSQSAFSSSACSSAQSWTSRSARFGSEPAMTSPSKSSEASCSP